MNLIYYRGLNCYLGSIINIVNSLGINYQDAFANLWSETDFNYDLKYKIFLSKRVFSNLEALGARIECLSCASPEETEEKLSLLPDKELFLVGMDTFHIPWSQVYQHFYEPHYFYAQKERTDALFCFDPVYSKQNVLIKYRDILSYAFDLRCIHWVVTDTPQLELKQEAQQILYSHPKMQQELMAEISACRNAGRRHIYPVIGQITAMINNRYLFERFLHQPSSVYDPDQRFFDKDFFSRWDMVKNGLIKSAIVKDNVNVIDEVCDLVSNLLHEELAMAEHMIV